MTLPKKRTLMIALLMATSLSQSGQGMDKAYGYQDNGWKLPRLTTALMCGAALLSNADAAINFGPQFRVNQNPAGTPATVTAGLSNGNVVIAWRDASRNMVARVFNPSGTAATNEIIINTVVPPTQVIPSVAALPGGNWCAAWQNGTSILSRFFYPNGTAINGPTVTNQITTYTAINSPKVAPFTDGNALISWFASSSGIYASKGRILSSLGIALSSEFTLCQSATVAGAPVLASLDNGNVYAVLGCGNLHGAQVWPNTTVVNNASPINISSSITGVSATGLPSSNAMVAYSQNFNLFVRLIQSGVPVGSEIQVLNVIAQVGNPNVNSLVDGTVLVTWDDGSGTSMGRFFSSNGTPLTNQVSIPTSGIGGATSAASLANGSGFFTAWADINNVYGGTVSFTTDSPTRAPTSTPNTMPTTAGPTSIPTTLSPTGTPNMMPTTAGPTSVPTTLSPTGAPNTTPTTAGPTSVPTTLSPTGAPNTTPTSVSPTRSPTRAPTTSSASRLTPGWWLPTKLVSQAFKAVVGLFQ
jgi:hypothetical protein